MPWDSFSDGGRWSGITLPYDNKRETLPNFTKVYDPKVKVNADIQTSRLGIIKHKKHGESKEILETVEHMNNPHFLKT